MIDAAHTKLGHRTRAVIVRCLGLCVFAIPACAGRSNPAVAEVCVAIAAEAGAQAALVALFNQFSATHGLYADESHPQAVRYSDQPKLADRDELVLINFRMGMGPHGAVLSLHRFDQAQNEPLMHELTTFLAEHVVPRHKVTDCREIEGFELPKAWR